MSANHQLAEPLPMRQEFTASIAIKSGSVMGFGTAYWMQGDRIAFTTELELERDDTIEIRMELTGFNDSAMGDVQILQTREEDSGILTCLGQITSMQKEDFEMLNQWLENLIAGNTASQSSRWLASITQSRGPQASHDETAAALRRLDKKMGNERRSASTTPSIAPISDKDTRSDARKRIGRQAIRAALRASVTTGGTPAPKPATSPAATPTASTPAVEPNRVAPPQLRVVPAPEDSAPAAPLPQASTPPIERETAPKEDSAGDVNSGLRANRAEDGSIHLSWDTPQSLIATWKNGLKSGLLTIPSLSNAPDAGESIRFRFRLPDGESFTLRGTIKQSDGAGVVCNIRIPWGTRIKLLRIQEAH